MADHIVNQDTSLSLMRSSFLNSFRALMPVSKVANCTFASYFCFVLSVFVCVFAYFTMIEKEQVDALMDRKESLKQELSKVQEDLQTSKESHRCVDRLILSSLIYKQRNTGFTNGTSPSHCVLVGICFLPYCIC